MRPQTQVKLNGSLLNKVRGERAREEECEEATIIDIWRTVGMGAYKHGEKERETPTKSKPQKPRNEICQTKRSEQNNVWKTRQNVNGCVKQRSRRRCYCAAG